MAFTYLGGLAFGVSCLWSTIIMWRDVVPVRSTWAAVPLTLLSVPFGPILVFVVGFKIGQWMPLLIGVGAFLAWGAASAIEKKEPH